MGQVAIHGFGRIGRTLMRIGLPLPLVFHPWFVAETLVPLLG